MCAAVPWAIFIVKLCPMWMMIRAGFSLGGARCECDMHWCTPPSWLTPLFWLPFLLSHSFAPPFPTSCPLCHILLVVHRMDNSVGIYLEVMMEKDAPAANHCLQLKPLPRGVHTCPSKKRRWQRRQLGKNGEGLQDTCTKWCLLYRGTWCNCNSHPSPKADPDDDNDK